MQQPPFAPGPPTVRPDKQEAVAARIGDDRQRGAQAIVLRPAQHRLAPVQDAC